VYTILVAFILGLFAAMLFVNIYFRVKILKVYKKLVNKGVEFDAKHVFNQKKLKEEVFPKYPDSVNDIQTFSKYMKFTISMATVLIILITLFGAVLMYYR